MIIRDDFVGFSVLGGGVVGLYVGGEAAVEKVVGGGVGEGLYVGV